MDAKVNTTRAAPTTSPTVSRDLQDTNSSIPRRARRAGVSSSLLSYVSMLESSANRVSRKEDVERNMSGAVKKNFARSAILMSTRPKSLYAAVYII